MTSRHIIYFAFLFVSLFFAGCDLFGSDEKSTKVKIRTDKNQYQIGQEVKFSATNKSKKPLFTQLCGPRLTFQVQRYDKSWESHYAPICKAIYEFYFESVAKPSETFRFSNMISEEGKYRAKLTYKIGSEGEKQVRYSNTFTVEE